MSQQTKRKRFWQAITLEVTEMSEHLMDIQKIDDGTNFFKRLLTIEIDHLISDSIHNDKSLVDWLVKYGHLLTEFE